MQLYVTRSEKISLITLVRRFDFSLIWNKLLNFIFKTIKVHLSGLLLLAAFLKHSCASGLVAQDGCKWLHSSVVLHKGMLR